MIELGSAPGASLLRWRKHFQYEVFGADTSSVGLNLQQEFFARNGIDERHSLATDFLDPAFHSEYVQFFDVVYSGGLIEHFTDPSVAISAHLRILKPGGLLVVTIPNLRGIYRHLLPRQIVQAHNVSIMTLPAFQALFPSHVQTLFCGYLGGLNLGLACSGDTLYSRSLWRLQYLANLIMRVISVPENRCTSPHLVFLGRRLDLKSPEHPD
jgi:SAM-dependent methyltransferase